jgi:hypothetical protein
VGGAADELDVHPQLVGLLADGFVQARVVEALDDLGGALFGLGSKNWMVSV